MGKCTISQSYGPVTTMHTKRKRGAFRTIVIAVCLQRTTTAWTFTKPRYRLAQLPFQNVQPSAGTKLNLNNQHHSHPAMSVSPPAHRRWHSALQSTPSSPLSPTLHKQRVWRVASRLKARSDGVQELENLRAAAAIRDEERPTQQEQNNQHKKQPRTRDESYTSSSRGGGTGTGTDSDGAGGSNAREEGAKRKLQSVDFTTALLMSRQLAKTIVPARIENAFQLDPYNMALGLRTLEGNMWLNVCWHPQGARCHVGGAPPREKEQKAYTFSQTLRSLIRGLNVVKVALARPFERVVVLDLAPRLDEPPSYRMYVEIMASRSNVVLVSVDSQGGETVAACAYQVSPSRSVRPLSTGQVYELPPAMIARRPSLEESLDDFVEGVGRVPNVQLKKALVGVYQGTSPALVNTMASCVPGLSPTTKVGDMTPEQWHTLYSGPWKRWVTLVGDGSTESQRNNDQDNVAAGVAVDDGSSGPSDTPWVSEDGLSYYATTLGGGGVEEDGGGRIFLGSSLQQVMERYYRETQSTEEFNGLKRRCVARITATLDKLRERAADFDAQVAAAQEDKVAELNRRGDLLVTYGHAWKQGETHVDCVDFDTGEHISIEIRSDKTPVEEAQHAFKQGKKLKRSAAVVRDLLDQVDAQILYAEGIEMALEQLHGSSSSTGNFNDNKSTGRQSMSASREELSVLRGISEELGLQGGKEAARRFASAFGVRQVQTGGGAIGGSMGVAGKRGGGGGGGKNSGGKKVKGKGVAGKSGGGGGGGKGGTSSRDSATTGLLELRRAPGCPAVLVGRNNLQNDRITFSVAKAHELWFHARGVAGAHVLLRLDPGQDMEDDDLQFAADVAVFFSKGRQSASTPVDYISPKLIKKLGGGGPGMVKYDGAKVVRGEPNRVEALVNEAIRLREEAASR